MFVIASAIQWAANEEVPGHPVPSARGSKVTGYSGWPCPVGLSVTGFTFQGARIGQRLTTTAAPEEGEQEIGKIRTDVGFHVESLDVTGPGSATVTGLDDGKEHTFRLWIRGGQVELYIDDLLMQTFFFLRGSGRIGFISQESEARFSDLKFYAMSL